MGGLSFKTRIKLEPGIFHKYEVIRKRLLIDGDGAGDDRRINLLVKSFIKWCNSGSQEEGYFILCFSYLK
uniref:THO complex subunit 7 homolog n=1 Tax=Chelonoidis abingdonii TaxID=106734 RepID=A0A8C0QME6_CHEAB